MRHSQPLHPTYPFPPFLLYFITMYAYSHSAPESGRCDACGQFFIREASLTKHRNSCPEARKLSKKLWKNGASNVKKLNLSQMASRKRVHEEVQAVQLHEDYDDLEHVEQPTSELVSTLLLFHSIITIHIILIGCAARRCCPGTNRPAPF